MSTPHWSWAKIRPGKYEVMRGRMIIGVFGTERDAQRMVNAGQREIPDLMKGERA